MATRIIGVESTLPRLPAAVVTATQGATAADLAPGDVAANRVLKAGDVMSGRLTIADAAPNNVPLRLLSGQAGNASLYFRDAANAANNARLTAFDAAASGVELAAERAGAPIKLLIDNVEQFTVKPAAAGGHVSAAPITLPGVPTATNHAATKGYVDTAIGAAAIYDRVFQGTVTNQSIPNGAGTLLAWDTEELDPLGWHAAAGNVVTPNVAGWYRVTVHWNWQATSTNTRRLVEVWRNGAAPTLAARFDPGSLASPGDTRNWSGSLETGLINMNGTTDTLAVSAFQQVATPAAQTISARVLVEWRRP